MLQGTHEGLRLFECRHFLPLYFIVYTSRPSFFTASNFQQNMSAVISKWMYPLCWVAQICTQDTKCGLTRSSRPLNINVKIPFSSFAYYFEFVFTHLHDVVAHGLLNVSAPHLLLLPLYYFNTTLYFSRSSLLIFYPGFTHTCDKIHLL